MKLPVLKIVKLTLCDLWIHRLQWLKVILAPMLLIGVGECVSALTPWFLSEGMITTLFSLVTGLLDIVSILLLTTNIYRYALLKEGGNRWWEFRLNDRLIELLCYRFAYGLITFCAAIPIAIYFVPSVLGYFLPVTLQSMLKGAPWISTGPFEIGVKFLFIPGLFYLLLRLGLYSLFISIDVPQPFRSSWRLLKGNMGRFFCLSILLGSFLLLPYLLSMYANLALSNTATPLFSLLITLSSCVLETLFLALLLKGFSLVYQTLNEKKGGTKKALAPRAKKQKALPK